MHIWHFKNRHHLNQHGRRVHHLTRTRIYRSASSVSRRRSWCVLVPPTVPTSTVQSLSPVLCQVWSGSFLGPSRPVVPRIIDVIPPHVPIIHHHICARHVVRYGTVLVPYPQMMLPLSGYVHRYSTSECQSSCLWFRVKCPRGRLP